jgi:hypothetical protein
MKKTINIFLVLICFFTINNLKAQVEEVADSTLQDDEVVLVKPEPDGKYKYGIKLGVQFSTLLGNENENNLTRFGINGGVYLRKKFKNEKWGYQVELNGSLRGSYFKGGPNDYSLIRLVYLDLPTLLFVNVSKDQNNKILFGPQFSYLVTSAIYKGEASVAYNDEPNLNKLDMLACAGYQVRLGHIAIQSLLKYGFININNGLLPEVLPKSQGKNMNNFSFELNFIF